MRRVKKQRSGFSLLELTTAIFVVTAGIFGIITLLQQGLVQIRTAQEYLIAEQAVINEIETVRVNLDQVIQRSLDIEHAHPFLSQSPALERLHNPMPQTTIRLRDDLAPDLYEVTARLRWTGNQGRTIEKSLTTLVAARGAVQ